MCLTPFFKSSGEGPFPCGKCPECRKRRASDWSFRLMKEVEVSTSAHFVTMTYDTDVVPITARGFLSLDKSEVQKFFKRLRKSYTGSHNVIKYYAVGEYGGRSRRPHYHAIIMGAQIREIELSWQLGSIHYGSVTPASVGYCLKYLSKPKTVPLHQNDDRVPEFSLMSKNWGCHI